MKVESREYKLLVHHEPFADPGKAARAVWDEIGEAAATLGPLQTKGEFEKKKPRRIIFLDTPDHTLRSNGLVLRQRGIDDEAEFTLKCRSEDRYFAAGADVSAAEGLKAVVKLEEDIAPPFVCRFSHSATISANGEGKARKVPRSLQEAAALFPILAGLQVDGRPCAPDTPVKVVNDIVVDETVWKGGKFAFAVGDDKLGKAAVALILWTRGKSARPVVAELSFRLKDSEENYSRALAESARAAFNLLLRLDCARLRGTTKTEFIYRDASRD
jgi:hypothetical protein